MVYLLIFFSGIASGAKRSVCPIEREVAQIENIEGDIRALHLFRNGNEIHAEKNTCILYGDKIVVGREAVVTLDTGMITKRVGGNYDSEWHVLDARGQVASSWAETLNDLYGSLTSHLGAQSAYATSRAVENCADVGDSTRPLKLPERLNDLNQVIGADIEVIVVALAPSEKKGEIVARLSTTAGELLAEDHTCGQSYLVLPLEPGTIRQGSTLSLKITNSKGDSVAYVVSVVDPDNLPSPPEAIGYEPNGASRYEWLLAAWRLASGPPETHLDAVARLWMAPPDAYGARRILRAISADEDF